MVSYSEKIIKCSGRTQTHSPGHAEGHKIIEILAMRPVINNHIACGE